MLGEQGVSSSRFPREGLANGGAAQKAVKKRVRENSLKESREFANSRDQEHLRNRKIANTEQEVM